MQNLHQVTAHDAQTGATGPVALIAVASDLRRYQIVNDDPEPER